MEVTKIMYEEHELAEIKNRGYEFSFYGMSEETKKNNNRETKRNNLFTTFNFKSKCQK